MLLLIPDVHDLKEQLGEMAFWGFKVTVQTFIGLFQLAIVLTVISIVFDPLTIRRELMTLLMNWYEQTQTKTTRTTKKENDSTDGLKMLAMSILATGTLVSAAIILASLYKAAFM